MRAARSAAMRERGRQRLRTPQGTGGGAVAGASASQEALAAGCRPRERAVLRAVRAPEEMRDPVPEFAAQAHNFAAQAQEFGETEARAAAQAREFGVTEERKAAQAHQFAAHSAHAVGEEPQG